MIPLVKRGAARGQAALPGRLAWSPSRPARRSPAASCAAARAGRAGRRPPRSLGLVPALFALRGGELAAYHGVEHKAIAAYEQDADDAREPPRSTSAAARTSSRRCSPPTWRARSLLRRLLEQAGPASPAAPSRSPRPPRRSRSSRGASATASTGLARAIRRPGFEIQRVVGTREPDERQLEVGRAALAEILRVEGAAAAA